MNKLYILLILLIIAVSCKKKTYGPPLTPEQKQEQKERSEPLLFNELIEQEGLRFECSPAVAVTISPEVLIETIPNVFSISEEVLKKNSEYTVSITTPTAISLDLWVIGFTSLGDSKVLTVQKPITSGTTAILRIKRGIVKYYFYVL